MKSAKSKHLLILAKEKGLLQGGRTRIVRGRMPEALVRRAKARTGIASDTDLIELALANIALADDFPEWLLSRAGTIDRNLDLEF